MNDFASNKKILFESYKTNHLKKINLRKKLSASRSIKIQNINEGRWSLEEHSKFLKACYDHGANWKKVEDEIKTRTISQIRSHAQKYLLKLCKTYSLNISRKKLKKLHLTDTNKLKPPRIYDINKINKYDKRFLELFKYFNKSKLLGETDYSDQNETTNNIINEKLNKKLDYKELKNNQNLNKQNENYVYSNILKIFEYNKIILNGQDSYNNIEETKITLQNLVMDYNSMIGSICEDYSQLKKSLNLLLS